VNGSHVNSQVAILLSPDSRWSLEEQPVTPGLDYGTEMMNFYQALRSMGLNVDVVFVTQLYLNSELLSGYKLVIAPSLVVVDEALADTLTQYVKGGGTLVTTYLSGVRDQTNVIVEMPRPGLLADIFGVSIHLFTPSNPFPQWIEYNGVDYNTSTWCEILTLASATSMATYSSQYFANSTAVSINQYGNGQAVYVGTDLSSNFYAQLMQDLTANWYQNPATTPSSVEYATRTLEDGSLVIFLLNYGQESEVVTLNQQSCQRVNLLSGESLGNQVSIGAMDVVVIHQQCS